MPSVLFAQTCAGDVRGGGGDDGGAHVMVALHPSCPPSVQLTATRQRSYALVYANGAGAPTARPSGLPHFSAASKSSDQRQSASSLRFDRDGKSGHLRSDGG